MCFNAAARHLPYASLGFLQYIAPTLVLLQAVLLFGEPLEHGKLLAFLCIWAGLLVFSIDSLRAYRRAEQPRSRR